MQFSNWKIVHKLTAAFGLIVTIMALVGAFAVSELRSIEATRANLDRETSGLAALREAKFYMSRQENSFRGWLVSHDGYYLERLASHRDKFVKSLDVAAGVVAQDAAATAKIETVRNAAAGWYSLVDGGAKRVAAGGDLAVADALVGRDGPADKAMGPAEDAVDSLIDAAMARRTAVSVSLAASVKTATIALVVGISLAALLAAVVGWVLSRAIGRPLSYLTGVMEKLAGGSLAVDVGDLGRKDEIGAMNRTVQVFKEQAIALQSTSAAVNDSKAMMAGVDRAMGVIEFDLGGNVLTANENFLKVLGYSLPEIQGRHHNMFVDRDYAASPQYSEFWRRLNAGEVIADKFTRIGRGGAKVVIEASYNPILGEDGKPYKVVKFATDVTAAETKLASSAVAVKDALAMLAGADRAMGIIEFDLAGNVLTANDNFLKVLGYSLSDIQGRHHQMFVERDYAASPQYADFWRRLNAGEVIADKFTRIGRGGAKVVIEASYNPILGEDGKPYKVVKFATDVTAAELAREEREVLDAASAREQAMVVAETARGLSALADGDLGHRIETAFPGEYAKLQTDFNLAISKLEEAMVVINTNASAMQTGAGEISQAADDLSRRTEQQAATLEETAAALDQITATVRRTAEGADRASTVVVSAKGAAEQSGVVVNRAVAAMGEIERSSDQISQIIGVIDEIAFQTNLLALNAGVEAARAGDAGRGFAVVASEVRALAQRSAEAAKEIKALIAASSGHVKDGVGLVGETGQALTAIVERVSEINGLMAEITASAQEQATALTQVNTAINQMDQTTQQNAAMVEQSTAASHNLSREAEELAGLVGKFQVSGAASGGKRASTAHPVRQAQTRIAEFAKQPARRAASGGAAAKSNEPTWEQF